MMKRVGMALAVLCCIVLAESCGDDDAKKPEGAGHGAKSPTGGALETAPIPYRAKGSKPALDKPEFRAAKDVTLPDGLNVIAVVINGEAKAYPTFILNQHQVVNDWLGGVPIAPSW